MPSRKRPRPTAVELPKYVYPIHSRCKTYYYFQKGRGTASAGPRIPLGRDPQSPEFWAAYRKAEGTSSTPTVNTVNSVADEYLRAASPTVPSRGSSRN